MSGQSVRKIVDEVIASIDAGLLWERRPLPRWVSSVAGPAAIGLAVGLCGCGSSSEPVGPDGSTDGSVDGAADGSTDGSSDGSTDGSDSSVEDCTDQIDNDGDGRCDCADDDCAGYDFCMPMCPAYGGPYSEVNCSDCRDDYDCDGLIDCDDPDCAGDPACAD